jgi:hypothetical protein
MDRRLHPGAVRNVAPDRPAFEHGGLGRLRLLRVPLPFLLGLRLYLVCTPTGMPITWVLANPKIGEREVLAAKLEVDADLVARREGILLITDKGFASKPFEKDLVTQGIELLLLLPGPHRGRGQRCPPLGGKSPRSLTSSGRWCTRVMFLILLGTGTPRRWALRLLRPVRSLPSLKPRSPAYRAR